MIRFLCCLLFDFVGLLHILYGQHTSLDVQFNAILTKNGHEQTIDVSHIEISEFLAVSVLLEGENINPSSVTGFITAAGRTFPVEHFHEANDDHKYVSELIYLPDSMNRTFKVIFNFNEKVDISRLSGKIHLFSPAKQTANILDSEQHHNFEYRSECECPVPAAVNRSVWGASFGLNENIYIPPATYTDVTHLIVHHSAGTNISSNWQSVVAAIFDFHVNTNGWQDIGYNWLIDPNGVLYKGRGGGDNVLGAHMCGYNSNTMGVCLLGNFVNLKPDKKALLTLKKLFSWKSCKEDINPEGGGPIVSYYGNMANISGHKDGCSPNYTSCPGQNVYVLLDSLREITQVYINSECSPVATENTASESGLTIVPNPSGSSISWLGRTNTREPHCIKIFNHVGILVKDDYLQDEIGYRNLDISELIPGLYWILIGNNKPLKFIKQ